MQLFRTPLLLTLLTGIPLSATCQLYESAGDMRGGGSYQGCNPSLTVDFSETPTDYLTYRFDPLISVGMNTVYSTMWSYFDGSFNQVYQDTLTHTFPTQGEHVVCLTANAFDQITQQPCSTTTCRIIQVLQDASCAALVADFTLQDISGQVVTFSDLSSFPEGILSTHWDFGDATTSLESLPVHSFIGSGPHRICLTVVGNGAIACTATLCKWLYLGPAPVPCDTLFDPGFIFLQEQNLVGVLDTSITSGMNSNVEWDFGDGATASGRLAIHAYSGGGLFQLCSTVRLWGPLLADTCANTLCIPVFVWEAVGVAEDPHEEQLLNAHPVPFQDQLYLGGNYPGRSELHVTDAQGRLVYLRTITTEGLLQLDLGWLAPGPYVIRCIQGMRVRSLRVLKQ